MTQSVYLITQFFFCGRYTIAFSTGRCVDTFVRTINGRAATAMLCTVAFFRTFFILFYGGMSSVRVIIVITI